MTSKGAKAFALVTMVIGIVFGIVMGAYYQVDVNDSIWSKDYEFNGMLMIKTWMIFDAIGFFFLWLSSALRKLENIEKALCNENPKSTVPVNTYNSALFKNSGTESAPKGQPSSGEWKCSKCGKVNQNYVGTCGCGEVKPN